MKQKQIDYKKLYFELTEHRQNYLDWLDSQLRAYADTFNEIVKNEPKNQIGSTAASQAMFALESAKNYFLKK